MTVSTTNVRSGPYAGNGVTTAFAVTFEFYAATDLAVIERTTATGVEVVKTLTTHYTVSGGAGSTGTVTAVTAPPAGVSWTVVRRTARTQSSGFVDGDSLPAKTIEDGFDRAVMLAQEADDQARRSIRMPDTDSTGTDMVLPANSVRAGKALIFDATGNVDVSTDDYEDQVPVAQAWASQTSGAVEGGEWSSKAHAIGGTGGPPGGAAKEWATSTSGQVGGTDYSAKEFAIGSQAGTGGSAKNWAQQSGGVTGAAAGSYSAKDWAIKTGATVDGTNYSAKHYAQGAATSEANAAGSAAAADASADAAAVNEANAAASAAAAAAAVGAVKVTASDTAAGALNTKLVPAKSITKATNNQGGNETLGIELVNDSASPGNNKVYGTDAAGVRGWKDDPSGGTGLFLGVASTGINRSVTTADAGWLIECTAAVTLSPDAAATLGAGHTFGVLNSSSGTVVIDPNGSETINGATTLSLNAGEWAFITCTGTAFKALRFTTTTPAGIAFSTTNKDADYTLSESNKRASMPSGAAPFGSILGDTAIVDKRYFEFEVISFSTGSGGSIILGIAASSVTLTDASFAASANGYGYIRSGNKINGGSSSGFGSAFTTNDIIGVAYDPSTGKLWFRLNGVWQGSGDPAAGTSPAFTVSGNQTMYPALYMDGNNTGGSVRIKSSPVYTPPSAFQVL